MPADPVARLATIAYAVMALYFSMYAMGKLFDLLLGWSFDVSIVVGAAIVLCYVFLGGLTVCPGGPVRNRSRSRSWRSPWLSTSCSGR